jgi:hypothetical protein
MYVFGYGKQMTTIKVRNLNIPRLPYPEKSKSGCNENFGVLKKVEHLKTTIIPNDVHVEITRNYGETDKVGELLLPWVSLF